MTRNILLSGGLSFSAVTFHCVNCFQFLPVISNSTPNINHVDICIFSTPLLVQSPIWRLDGKYYQCYSSLHSGFQKVSVSTACMEPPVLWHPYQCGNLFLSLIFASRQKLVLYCYLNFYLMTSKVTFSPCIYWPFTFPFPESAITGSPRVQKRRKWDLSSPLYEVLRFRRATKWCQDEPTDPLIVLIWRQNPSS